MRAPPPKRQQPGPTEPVLVAALEVSEATRRPEGQEDDEDEEELLPHSEAVDVFQEGLAMVVQDPLLCDLPIQVSAGSARGAGGWPQTAGDSAFGRKRALPGQAGRQNTTPQDKRYFFLFFIFISC